MNESNHKPKGTLFHFLRFIDLTICKETPIVFGRFLKFDMLALTLAELFESLVSIEVLI